MLSFAYLRVCLLLLSHRCITAASLPAVDECCLCENCNALEPTREGAFVYNDRTNTLSTCEDLAWELVSTDTPSDSPTCRESQSMFRSTCCTAEPLSEPVRVTNDADESSLRRSLWGSSSWTASSPSSSFTSSFPSSSYSSFNNAVTRPTTTSWGNSNRGGSSFSNSGGSCSLCPTSSMRNPSLGIVVNGPGYQFTGTSIVLCYMTLVAVVGCVCRLSHTRTPGACRDINSNMAARGISKSHQMCGVTIARFRHDCQCGGAQNNAASFFGSAPNSSGLNKWCIKGFTC